MYGRVKKMLLVAGIVLLISGIVGMIFQIQNIREKSE
jgi:preprotein translocase subunit Sss1